MHAMTMHSPAMTRHHFTPSRMMQALDFPVTDPFGGPAYGRFEKGGGGLGMVIGIVASVVTMGVGAAAWAAAAAASNIGGMIAAGAMVAGGAMSGIGTITGNKKLTRIGGVLSLAGGAAGSFMDVAGNAVNPMATEGAKSLTAQATSDAMSSVSSAFTKASDALGFGKESAGLTNNVGGIQTNLANAGESTLSGAADPLAKAAGDGAISQAGNLSNFPGGNLGNIPADTAGGLTQSIGGMPDALGNGVSASGASVSQGMANTATLPASQLAKADSGILGQAMKFSQTPGGGYMTGQLISGIGAGIGNQGAIDMKQQELDLLSTKYGNDQALLQQQLKNVNYQYQIIDPNDPQAAQKQAQAKAAGIPTISIGVNQAANVQMPNNNFKPQGV